jgi:hypothetical protein
MSVTREPIAQLYKVGSRYELVYPQYNLSVRAQHAEWALEAGGEIITRLDRLKAEGLLDEMEMMKGFGDDPEIPFKINALRYESNSRFDLIPQCVVTVGDVDYRWTAADGRKAKSDAPIERMLDTSKTRDDTTFSIERFAQV